MRKNFGKKAISLALIAAMSVTMVTGCGNNKKAKNDGKTTVTLGIWPSDDLVDDISTFEGYVDTMKELHPDVVI